MSGLSISSLRKNSEFEDLYSKMILGGRELTEKELSLFLEIAILFLNSKDSAVRTFGYRIIVLYTIETADFIPLYEVSLSLGYYPISKVISDKNAFFQGVSSFLHSMQESFIKSFTKNEICFTHEQSIVRKKFLKGSIPEDCAIVAPTSYGKSDMIIRSIKNKGNVCIVVPTKALISQTKKRVIFDSGISSDREIITHHEMYESSQKNIIAILTQERLVRLMHLHPSLSFEAAYVDEAHNLLENNDRSKLLAASLILLRSRNEDCKMIFLTPFLKDPENLKLSYYPREIESLSINESLKSELYFVKDFRSKGRLKIYDQYFDKFYEPESAAINDEVQAVKVSSGAKNIVYINRPSGVIDFSLSLVGHLPLVTSSVLDRICDDIKDYIHEDYSLIECLKRGVAYHHGSMPDGVRLYVEHIYSKETQVRFVVTTSTLLEGVNIPGEKLFMLSNKKGPKKLSPSQFKNLVGRVCRFGELFAGDEKRLKLLRPEIYMFAGKYTDKSANIEKFAQSVAKVGKEIKDKVDNVLLQESDRSNDIEQKQDILDFIENLSPGATGDSAARQSVTEIGSLCFEHNVNEFSIIENEEEMQDKLDKIKKSKDPMTNLMEVFQVIDDLFLCNITDERKFKNLLRLRSSDTQRFYAFFVNMKMQGWPLSRMISSFVAHWAKVESSSRPFAYVGSWGDEAIDETRPGFRNWVDLRNKSASEKVNLAIVRVKEEQEFVENFLLKFIEILHELNLVETEIYLKIRYGTSDADKIALIQSGISPTLSSLIFDKYSKYFSRSSGGGVRLGRKILHEMKANGENGILIFEASYNVRD